MVMVGNTGRRRSRAIASNMDHRLVMVGSTGRRRSGAIASNMDHGLLMAHSTERRSSKGITTVTDPRRGPPQFIAAQRNRTLSKSVQRAPV